MLEQGQKPEIFKGKGHKMLVRKKGMQK